MTFASVTGYGMLAGAMMLAVVDLVRPMPGLCWCALGVLMVGLPLLERS